MIHVNRKMVVTVKPGKESFNLTMADLFDPITVAADPVMMRWNARDFIIHLSADLGGDDQAHIAQEVEGAINRHPVDGG